MIAEDRKIDDLASKLREVKAQLFSGQIVLESQDGQKWYLFCYLGRILYATGGSHPIRRWVRSLTRFAGETIGKLELADRLRLFTDISALTNEEVKQCWEYYLMVTWAQQKRINREALIKHIQSVIVDVFFDIAQAGSVSWRAIAQEPLNPQIVLIDIEQAHSLAGQKWESWQQAHLVAVLPDRALAIVQPERLKAMTAPRTYEVLNSILDGQSTIREIATKTRRPSIDIARSLLPYIQSGIVRSIEITDFPSPVAIPTRSQGGKKDGSSNADRSCLIACIDDSPFVCERVEKIIGDIGHKFLGVVDADRAIPLIVANQPQLIFLDLLMPNTNGYEICSRLRKVTMFRETPIVILTGNDGVIDRVRAKMVGATDYVTKPVETNTIVQIVNKYLPELSASTDRAIDDISVSV
jgi:chemotaxis family two-component system response regulator PixG